MRFTVYLVGENKHPVAGERVNVSFMSPAGVWLEDAVTNGEGHALFINDNLEPGGATFTVSDKSHGPYSVNDGDSFTIQV